MNLIKFGVSALIVFAHVATAQAAEKPVVIGGTGAAMVYANSVGKEVQKANPDITIKVIEGLGSGGAMRALIAGRIDLAISGRVLKQKEIDAGLTATPLMKTPFGFFTSRQEPISVSSADVWRLYNDVSRPNPLFDGQVVRVILRPKSDSDRAFAIANFEGMKSAIERAHMAPGIPVAQTDQDNASMAEKMSNSLTTGTLLQMVSEGRTLTSIQIDGVQPSAESVKSGAYKYAKTLHLVTRPERDENIVTVIDYIYSSDGVTLAAHLGGHILH